MNVRDPYYQSEPARYLRWLVEDLHGIEINISDRLTAPATVNRELRAIWVAPGLELTPLHWLLARGAMELQFPGSVPELQLPHPRDPNEPGDSTGAVILPLRPDPRWNRRADGSGRP